MRYTDPYKPMPSAKLNSEPKEKLMSAKARNCTSGSRRVSMRQKNSTPEIAEITPHQAIVRSENQSHRSPSSSTYSKVPRNSAISIRPAKSKPRRRDQSGRSMSSQDH